ncbi:DNA (cytosine-5-)-methyltransferase [Undibacterium sp. CY18W]|uniref:DNA (cytosine-5-)-methyltransferase n=1 Tax=Undibacterium hunanense TaxID=2762292 RepID=A0ABR6ZLR3_9BURK|nr:DNA (cytosine-5-)-methyltransferase [Undibacterium hunanense]MBC3916834.1 DNA (cytosine-5-)-methyltransferase [Undibacterium hunanense]
MNVVEFFAGAGGLAQGLESAGFRHLIALDFNSDACETLKKNYNCNVILKDVREFQFEGLRIEPTLFAGGPPCQPFSTAGRHAAESDHRNGFPDAIRAVRHLKPNAFIFENVNGLLRKNWEEYVTYLVRQLQEPELTIKPKETWYKHSERLNTAYLRKVSNQRTRYQVQMHLVNAANYGVPQKRLRVIFVGFREDLSVRWSLPLPTYSEESLLHSKWITGEYWDEHGITAPICSDIERKKVSRVLEQPELLIRKRWRTVRDALKDLQDPEVYIGNKQDNIHAFIPGARSYKGHTGSDFDQPAKTIKSGVNGIGGGENMLRRENGSVRYFTILELLRLQSFPDNYQLFGTRSSVIKQIGNAVPPLLAYVIANSIKLALQRRGN